MPRINWGQAAGEASLILVGILLALAADAWWEERGERRQEREYLVALAAELDQMSSHVGGIVQGTEQIVGAGRALLQITPDWSSAASSDSLAALIALVSSEVEWSPPNTVYQDLVNTGAVQVLRSDDVRRSLNDLMREMTWVESRQVRHNEFFWSEMEPSFRRHLPILEIFGWDELMSSSGSWVPGDFIGTEEFRNLMAAKTLTALDVQDGAEALLGLINEVSGTITAEIGDS